jgi:hypothetical protein
LTVKLSLPEGLSRIRLRAIRWTNAMLRGP